MARRPIARLFCGSGNSPAAGVVYIRCGFRRYSCASVPRKVIVNMDRRSFVKSGLATGAVGIVGGTAIGRALAAAPVRPDIVAIKGADAFASTNKALQALGGIGRFVSKGSRVGLLINAPVNWWLEGSHTRMEVALAVAKLCFDAGAKEVVSLPVLSPKFWTGSSLAEAHASVVSSIRSCSGRTVDTKIPNGVRLKSAKLRVELLDVDVLVNIPVAKHALVGLEGLACRKRSRFPKNP